MGSFGPRGGPPCKRCNKLPSVYHSDQFGLMCNKSLRRRWEFSLGSIFGSQIPHPPILWRCHHYDSRCWIYAGHWFRRLLPLRWVQPKLVPSWMGLLWLRLANNLKGATCRMIISVSPHPWHRRSAVLHQQLPLKMVDYEEILCA